MSYNTNLSIFDRSSGVISNGLNESTPQIKFENGLPFMIPFAMKTEMSAENNQSIQIENDMCAMVTEVNTIENNHI